MAEIITIKPKKGTRSFSELGSQMIQFNKVEQNGELIDKATGEYKAEKFPNSRQMFRPSWGEAKKRWKLKGFMDDITSEKQEELNKLVKACKFRYPDEHPKARQVIEEADIFDSQDPFFNHRQLRLLKREGQATLNKSRPLDQILHLAMMVDPEYAQAGESDGNPLLSKRVKFIMTDKNIDASIKRDRREKEMKVVKLFENLSDAKRLKVAMAMGFISSEKTDKDQVNDVLWEVAKDDKKLMTGSKLTRQDVFIKMCETTMDELDTRQLIQKAKAGGFLKRDKSQGWMLFGHPVGRNDAQLFAYFNDKENQKMMLRLEDAINNG